MRTVVDRHLLPHLWANQSQDHATTPSRNYHFTGPILTSYSTPIAALATYRGESIALISRPTFSNITAGQIRGAVQSLPPHIRKVYVESVPRAAYQLESPKELARLLRAEADYLKTETDMLFKRATQPGLRSNSIAARLRDANAAANAYDKFVEANKLNRKPYARPETLDSLRAAIDREEKRAAKAEKARIAKAAAEWEKRKAEALAELEEWEAGDRPDRRLTGDAYKLPPRLRLLEPSGKEPYCVRTSHGAEVSLGVYEQTQALTVLGSMRRRLQHCIDNHGTEHARQDIAFGSFRLSGYDPTSQSFQIGCHTIPLESFNRLADRLGIDRLTAATCGATSGDSGATAP